MQRPGNRFTLFGSPIESEMWLDLPRSNLPGQVKVEHGTVVESGDLVFRTNDPLQFACYRHGETVILVWSGARFRIRPGQVLIDAEDVATAAQLLVPAAWSVVLSAHDRESFHGSAVEYDGKAIAILGHSGSGKTTAARGLIDHGASLLSDDLLTFDDELRVIPGPPWMRLVADPERAAPSIPDAGGKFRIFPSMCSSPTPLSAIVIMAPEYEGFGTLSGTSAVSALLQHVYNPVLTHAGQVQRRFDIALDLVNRVPVYGTAPRSISAEQLLENTRERIA